MFYVVSDFGACLQVEFLRPMTAGILSERRAVAPFGLFGGQPGAKGLNLLVSKASGKVVNLGGKATVQLEAGDVLQIHTPGAGGYGPVEGGGEGEDGGQAAWRLKAAAAAGVGGEGGGEGGGQKQHVELSVGSVHEYKRMQESA